MAKKCKKIGQCGETFLAFRMFLKFSMEFDWPGKIQKSGKLRSTPLIFSPALGKAFNSAEE
jgi:hypothetical protein